MKPTWLFFGFLALNFIFSTAGDTTAKLWAIHPGQKWMWIMLGINVFTGIFYMLVIRQSSLAIGGMIMLLLTMFAQIVIGLFFFKEHVNSGQWIGVGLALVAVLFLSNVLKVDF